MKKPRKNKVMTTMTSAPHIHVYARGRMTRAHVYADMGNGCHGCHGAKPAVGGIFIFAEAVALLLALIVLAVLA
jgi:hypothetical protein